MKPTTKLALVVIGGLLAIAAATPVIPTTVYTRLMLRMDNAADIQAHLGVQPGNTNLTNFVTSMTVDGAGNLVTPGTITTPSGNVDTRIDSVVSSLGSFTAEDFVFGGQTNANPVGLKKAHFEGPPSVRLDAYEGGTVLLDLDQPGFFITATNDVLSIGYANVPSTTGSLKSWPFTVTNAFTNLVTIEYGSAVPDSQVAFDSLGTNEVAKFRLFSENNVLTYQYVGPQVEVLPPALGGTGKTTGEAQAPKSIVGFPTYSSVTNAEINLGAGTIIRLDNTKDVLINTTASRLASSETNGLGQVRTIEMLNPAADRIVWVETNNFGLRGGMAQSNFVAAGTVFRATLVNWGASVNHNYLDGGGTGVPAGGGSTPVDLNDFLFTAWLGTNSSGNLTDSTGNGISGVVVNGFAFTYSQPGKVEANSMTNNAGGNTGITNAALNAMLRGTNSWTIMGWHVPNSVTANRYIAANWNNGSGDSWRFFTGTDGQYKLSCYTNSTSTTLDSGLYSSLATWHHYALVYDKDVPEIRFVVDGVQSAIPLAAALDSPATSGFTYGGYWSAGTISTAFRGAIEQFLVYTNKAMALDDIQRIYNSGTGKAFSTF